MIAKELKKRVNISYVCFFCFLVCIIIFNNSIFANTINLKISGNLLVDNTLYAQYSKKEDHKLVIDSDTSAYNIQSDETYLDFGLNYVLFDGEITSSFSFFADSSIGIGFDIAKREMDEWEISASYLQYYTDLLGNSATPDDYENLAFNAPHQYIQIKNTQTGVYYLAGRKQFFDHYIKGLETTNYLITSHYLLQNTYGSYFNALNTGIINDLIDIGVVYSEGNPIVNPYQSFFSDYVGGYAFQNEDGIGGFGEINGGIDYEVGTGYRSNTILIPSSTTATSETTVNSRLFGVYSHMNVTENFEISLEYFLTRDKTDKDQLIDIPDNSEDIKNINYDNLSPGYLDTNSYGVGTLYKIDLSEDFTITSYLNISFKENEGKQATFIYDNDGNLINSKQASLESRYIGYQAGSNIYFSNEVIMLSFGARDIKQEGTSNTQGNFVDGVEGSGDKFLHESYLFSIELVYRHYFINPNVYIDSAFAHSKGQANQYIDDVKSYQEQETMRVLGIRFGYSF